MGDCNEKKHEKMHDMKEEKIHEIKGEKHKMDYKEEEMWQRLYPDSYMCIHMAMENRCEMMEKEKGKSYIPNRDEFERMIDEVLQEIEDEMKFMDDNENEHMDEDRENENDDRDDEDNEDNDMKRFTPYGGRRRRRRRRLNRDLLSLLLLGQLYGRRRPYPPYYPPRPYPPPHTPYGPYPGY